MLTELINHCNYRLGIAVLISSALAAFLLPIMIKWSSRSGLLAKPNHRTSHKNEIPSGAGLVLYIAILVPILLLTKISFIVGAIWLALAFGSLFVIGIIDDFRNVKPKMKLFGQVLAATVLVFSFKDSGLDILFLESAQLPFIFKAIFWIIFIVGIINAYNFIDGIDGLAASLGIYGSLIFGFMFVQAGLCDEAVIAVTLAGALGAYLPFNFSNKLKIFIGDSGSLLVGGIMGFFSIMFLSVKNLHLPFNDTSFFILGVNFIPLADMVRVIIKRLVKGKSPLLADREHIHHVLIDSIGLSHFQATRTLLLVQVIIGTMFYFYHMIFDRGFFIIILIALALFTLSTEMVERKIFKKILSKA